MRIAMAFALALSLAGCGGEEADLPTDTDVPADIMVTSTAFEEGEAIPVRYTCDGEDLSPPLAWSGVPSDAAALALVVDDPDAPRGTFTHWVVLDIPVATTSSEEGGVPAGGIQAESSAGSAVYAGPCPPSGTHHYRFTVLALDVETGLDEGASLDQALEAMDDHVVARGTLTGTYARD